MIRRAVQTLAAALARAGRAASESLVRWCERPYTAWEVRQELTPRIGALEWRIVELRTKDRWFEERLEQRLQRFRSELLDELRAAADVTVPSPRP